MGWGVFAGKKWACMDLLLFEMFMMIRVNQMGAPTLRVVIKWEVRVIVNGAAPHKFIMIIKYRVGAIIDVAPFMNVLLVDLAKEDAVLIMMRITADLVEEVVQYMWVNIKVGRRPHK